MAIRSYVDVWHMGEVSKILGLSVQRDHTRCTLTISQTTYIEETLQKFKLTKVKPANLSLSDRGILTATQVGKTRAIQSLYQQSIGRRGHRQNKDV